MLRIPSFLALKSRPHLPRVVTSLPEALTVHVTPAFIEPFHASLKEVCQMRRQS